jgi:ABC-type glycerol-3-phosphate transport system substrate-binding protein
VLARRFLQHLTGPGVQQRFTSKLSKLPARRDVWSVLEDSMEYFSQLERSYEQGVPVPAERSYGIYKNTMWKLLRFVFSGKMGVPEVLKTGQRLIDNKQK